MTTKVGSSVIADRSIGSTQLANTAITAGTYGGGAQVPYVTIDAQGRATAAGNTALSVANTQLSATGTANSTTYLRGDNTWASIVTPTAASLGLGTTDNVQHASLGIGQAASGVAGEIKATKLYANVAATNVTFGDSTVQTTASPWMLLSKGASATGGAVTIDLGSSYTIASYRQLKWVFQARPTTVSTNYGTGLLLDYGGGAYTFEYQVMGYTGGTGYTGSYSNSTLYAFAASSSLPSGTVYPVIHGEFTLYLGDTAPMWNNSLMYPVWFQCTTLNRNAAPTNAMCVTAGHIMNSYLSSASSFKLQLTNWTGGSNFTGTWEVYGIPR